MSNIKLGNKVYSGVDTLKAKNADNESEYISFKNDYIEEVATAEEMTALLIEANVGKVYRFVGTTGIYTNGRLYKVIQATSNEYTFDELITPVGSITKTENGTYNVKEYAEVVVNVPQLDTSDANATASDIRYTKSAYVNGVKIEGQMQDYANEVANLYSITATLTNVSGNIPEYIEEGETLKITLTANDGYTLPDSVSVSGCTYSYSVNNGELTLSNATSDVSIEVVGREEATGGTLTISFLDDARIGGYVKINGAQINIDGTQTRVFENVKTFLYQGSLASDISNQTGSMVGVTNVQTTYNINGDGSATIEFYD